jgi:hypothetical protein
MASSTVSPWSGSKPWRVTAAVMPARTSGGSIGASDDPARATPASFSVRNGYVRSDRSEPRRSPSHVASLRR